MRCRVCDYQLWNLQARRCPECGTPFLPSQYEFAPSRVCFCCPHCGQSYYGTGDKGHLVPRDFDCVTCARHVDMDEMVLRPAEGYGTEDTEGARLPWLDRRRRGFWRGWAGTIGMALVKPMQLGRLLPPDTALGSATGFAVMTGLAIGTVGLLPLLLFSIAPVAFVSGPGWGEVGLMVGLTVASLFLYATVGIVLGVGIWSLVTHGLLRLTGSTREGPGRSFACLCYASGANVLTAVPCFGPYIGWIWWLISGVLTVKEGQRVTGARAAFAVLAMPLVLVGAVVAFYVWLFTMSIPGAVPAASVQIPYGSENLSAMVVALQQYAYSHRGSMPAHALRLLESGDLAPDEFVSPDSAETAADITFDGRTLEDLPRVSAAERARVVQAAAGRLPAGVVAHRVGDYVFTYHGIDLASNAGGLWLVIEWPLSTQGAGSGRFIRVADGRGTVTNYSIRGFPGALAIQNDLRQRSGLPPLPHPDTVTQDRPAAGP